MVFFVYFNVIFLCFFFKAQIQYNKDLCSSRSRIEQAFGRLKGKWRKLKYIEILKLSHLSHIIMAACLLHNFLIDWANDKEYVDEVDDEDDYEDDDEDEDEDEDEDHFDQVPVADQREEGSRRRQLILRRYE